MSDKIVICRNCGEPYYFYKYTVADQSCCPACISKLKARTYIWVVFVKSCEFRDLEREKPYMRIEAMVEEGDHAGFGLDFRIYVHAKSRSWATWFLKRFGYPEELLDSGQPTLRRREIEGLHGKVHVEVEVDGRGFLRFNAKGFDRIGGTELEDRLAKQQKVTIGTTPEVDIMADVKGENGLGVLDQL